jgi:hypothetical protein
MAYERVKGHDSQRLAFSVAFALFEYCLKECGYFRGHDYAKADWPRFSKRQTELGMTFDAIARDAVDYILSKPPRVQIVEPVHQNFVVFQDRDLRGTEHARICEALRRIRNNLLHGGKQPYEFQRRDERLVRAGLKIIEAYLNANDDLAAMFAQGMG